MHPADETTRSGPRTRLSRHPVAVEAARLAARLTGAPAEVVVFEGTDYAFVAAADDVAHVLQPRPLVDSERRLLRESGPWASSAAGASVAIAASEGRPVAALTVRGTIGDHLQALAGLGRMITAAVAQEGDTTLDSAILDGLRDAVLVITPTLTVRWANRAIGSLLGYTPSEIVGREGLDFLHPDDVATVADAIARMGKGLEMYRVVVRMRRSSGEWAPVEVTGVDHSDDPLLGGLVLSLRSGERRDEAEVVLARTQRMSTAIVEHLPDGIVASDEVGSIRMLNPAARELFGLDPSVPLGELDLSTMYVADPDGRVSNLATIRPRSDETEYGVISEDGRVRYVTVDLQELDADGDDQGRVVVLRDITDARTRAEELRSQARHDQLTGLPNRRQLDERLAELSADRPPHPVAACFIDLDGFKLINDTHGHRMGDRVVITAAERLSHQLRSADLLVRQGGDEFVVLLPGIDGVETAARVAERFREALGRPYVIDSVRFDVTASVGVSVLSTSELDGDLLLQQADMALYAAKNRGRNRVEVFDRELAEAASVENTQRSLVRSALDDNRLVMLFQPLVDPRDDRIAGYEALARLRSEDGELLSPAAFMAAVSSTSLVWELDRAAFDLSCQALQMLCRAEGPKRPFVACNFSGVSIGQPEFAETIETIARRHHVDPATVRIEITESAALDAGPGASETLMRLHRAGFRLSLDDFGTGYSSLAHLRDLPISTVKVDRSFVARLGEPSTERAIAEAVVTLALELGMGVVAEGVETPGHLDEARRLGFSEVQGWHYAPALSLSDCLAGWREQVERDAEGVDATAADATADD